MSVHNWLELRESPRLPASAVRPSNIKSSPIRSNLQARGLTLTTVMDAVARSNAAVGGDVVHKGNAEFVVRSVGWLGRGAEGATPEETAAAAHHRRSGADCHSRRSGQSPVQLSEVATISVGSRPRRGSLEKDGNEVCGGVVMMRHGENPLEVTRRLRAKILEIGPGLPEGVQIVPNYDRTPLIEGAVDAPQELARDREDRPSRRRPARRVVGGGVSRRRLARARGVGDVRLRVRRPPEPAPPLPAVGVRRAPAAQGLPAARARGEAVARASSTSSPCPANPTTAKRRRGAGGESA